MGKPKTATSKWNTATDLGTKQDRKNQPGHAKKSGGGRPATVDYERGSRINVCVTKELNALLSKAVAVESGKRFPDKVDRGLIIEEALTAWFSKKGY